MKSLLQSLRAPVAISVKSSIPESSQSVNGVNDLVKSRPHVLILEFEALTSTCHSPATGSPSKRAISEVEATKLTVSSVTVKPLTEVVVDDPAALFISIKIEVPAGLVTTTSKAFTDRDSKRSICKLTSSTTPGP